MHPSAKQVRDLFDYDAHTGILTRRVYRHGGKGPPIYGRLATTHDKSTGYLKCNVENRNWLAHRVIWLWVTGEWPTSNIDHDDTDKTNNRWKNLRVATQSQNIGNSKHRINNTSGYKGVFFCEGNKTNPWRAVISAHGQTHHLGYFSDQMLAVAAYDHAAIRLFGEFARANLTGERLT